MCKPQPISLAKKETREEKSPEEEEEGGSVEAELADILSPPLDVLFLVAGPRRRCRL